jgi:hypothetical protein
MTRTFFDPDDDDDSGTPRANDGAIGENSNGNTMSSWQQDLQSLSLISDSLEVLKDEHKDVRVVNDSILRISGLLLTITLGAIYFSYDNSDTIPRFTKLFLFLSSILLGVTIFVSIFTLKLKSQCFLEKIEFVNAMQETTDSENKWTNRAVKAMLVSVTLLIIGITAFAICQAHDEISYNLTLLFTKPAELIHAATNVTYWFGLK